MSITTYLARLTGHPDEINIKDRLRDRLISELQAGRGIDDVLQLLAGEVLKDQGRTALEEILSAKFPACEGCEGDGIRNKSDWEEAMSGTKERCVCRK